MKKEAVLVSIGILVSSLSVTTVAVNTDNSINGVNSVLAKSSKTKKINKAIAKTLEQEHGWANGSLDENGNPTNNGTPNEDFAWSAYIQKIKYSGSSLTIYVIPEFKNLSKGDRATVIETAMRSTYSDIGDYKHLDQEFDVREGIYTEIYLNDVPIGHSKLSNHYSFKWYE